MARDEVLMMAVVVVVVLTAEASGHRLCEIARLIDIIPAAYGDVVVGQYPSAQLP